MYDKVIKGSIIPSSVIESKKQKKITNKLEKWFGKNIKALSPVNCLPRIFTRTGKNKVFQLSSDEFEFDRPNVEIYENEFASIEMKNFGQIVENMAKRSKFEIIHCNSSASNVHRANKHNTRNLHTDPRILPAPHTSDMKKNLTFALLFGDESHFNDDSVHTTPPVYLDEDELSQSVEFSINESDMNSCSTQHTAGGPIYQTIDKISRFMVQRDIYSIPDHSDNSDDSTQFSDSDCLSDSSFEESGRFETERFIVTRF